MTGSAPSARALPLEEQFLASLPAEEPGARLLEGLQLSKRLSS